MIYIYSTQWSLLSSEATISPRERSRKVRASAAHTTYTVCHSKSSPVFIAGNSRRDMNWSSPMKGQLLGEWLLWASRTSAVGFVLTDEEISMRAVGWSSCRTFADINMLEKQQRAEPDQFNPSCRETGKGHGLPTQTTKILRCQT